MPLLEVKLMLSWGHRGRVGGVQENTNAFKVYGGVEGVAADKMAQ